MTGIVQGVGFRPYVFCAAERLGLRGFVKNRPSGVLVEAEGDPRALDALVEELRTRPPRLARVVEIQQDALPVRGDTEFRIEASDTPTDDAFVIGPDAATCEECQRELFDRADRRHNYPFLNCTSCGPRLTIVTGAPYDRERTTMASFAMCDACRAEYDDPRDRRFHAQPVACPACGPRLRAEDPRGGEIAGDPFERAAEAIALGQIVAIKGIGGFHLACDATNDRAVATLRERKQRDAKPFAIMVRDLEAAREIGVVGEGERALLESPACPIVLLARRERTRVARTAAPGMSTLGVMLPYTPVHHLLFARVGESPLVMTSANRADEPVAYHDDDARARLAHIADLFLVHDRPIETLCDDSVVRVIEGAPLFVRRARGYAPEPLRLPQPLAKPTLALGGHMKATFALGVGRDAWVSHHLGDLDGYEALRAYEAAIAHYEELFRLRPERLVHDLHPDYASTRYALARAAKDGLEIASVQHHHAHVASVMAEHGLAHAIGVAFDGTGFGPDGAIWGGEIFVGALADLPRAAHLGYVRAPGGDSAIREPWRMALSHLVHAGEDVAASGLAERTSAGSVAAVRAMIERGVSSPLTSSAGRLFDAIASLISGHDSAAFEGQAAMRVEALAESGPNDASPYAFDVTAERDSAMRIDPRPLVRDIVRDMGRGESPAIIARRFHATLAAAIAQVAAHLRDETAISDVVLGGGGFVNAILTAETSARLRAKGMRVHTARILPPNDGGLSFGQLAVVAARDAGMVGGR